jgi:hypothetical protein
VKVTQIASAMLLFKTFFMYFTTIFQDHTLSGASVDSTSKVCTSAVLVLPPIDIRELKVQSQASSSHIGEHEDGSLLGYCIV